MVFITLLGVIAGIFLGFCQWLPGTDVVANSFLGGCYGIPADCQGVVMWI